MKQMNRVLLAVEAGADCSTQVAQDTGLSRNQASAYLSQLKNHGILQIVGRRRSRCGAPSAIYRLTQGQL